MSLTIALLEGRGGSGGFHLLFKVQSNVGVPLLDVADDLTLSGGSKGISSLSESLHEVV